MRQWSIVGMPLSELRHLFPSQVLTEAPISRAEFEHIINETRAGQIYLGEPTVKVFHWRLNSGLHSACYLNCALVLAETNLLSIFAAQLTQACDLGVGQVDWVVGSAMASVSLASEIARQLRCRAAYVEKGSDRALEHFRFIIPEGERVFVVNELMTTGGGTTYDTKRLVQEKNPFEVVFLPFAGVLVSRSKDEALKDGTPVKHVFRFDNFPTYPPPECPFCAAGSPIFGGGKKDWAKFLAQREERVHN